MAYDEVVHDVVTAGGRVLVVQTNNATFAGLGQPEQQIAMSRLRAVEHGRAVLVAATSGISAVISPDGAVVAEIGEANVGALVETVALRDTLTVADRVGQVLEWIFAGLGLFAMVWAAVRRRGVDEAPAVAA